MFRLLRRHLLPECGDSVSVKKDDSLVSSAEYPSIFRLSPYVIQTILGAVSVAGTVPALILIETWGRRRVSTQILTTRFVASDPYVVASYRCFMGSRVCNNRWAGRTFHAGAHWYACLTTHSTQQERRRHTYCVRCASCVWFLDVLGPYAVGVSWRELPVESTCQGNRIG